MGSQSIPAQWKTGTKVWQRAWHGETMLIFLHFCKGHILKSAYQVFQMDLLQAGIYLPGDLQSNEWKKQIKVVPRFYSGNYSCCLPKSDQELKAAQLFLTGVFFFGITSKRHLLCQHFPFPEFDGVLLVSIRLSRPPVFSSGPRGRR